MQIKNAILVFCYTTLNYVPGVSEMMRSCFHDEQCYTYQLNQSIIHTKCVDATH